jgi:hypothetical protein
MSSRREGYFANVVESWQKVANYLVICRVEFWIGLSALRHQYIATQGFALG